MNSSVCLCSRVQFVCSDCRSRKLIGADPYIQSVWKVAYCPINVTMVFLCILNCLHLSCLHCWPLFYLYSISPLLFSLCLPPFPLHPLLYWIKLAYSFSFSLFSEFSTNQLLSALRLHKGETKVTSGVCMCICTYVSWRLRKSVSVLL